MDINDIFQQFGDIFGNGFGGFGGFGGRSSSQPRRFKGADMRMKVRLTLEEISTGVVKNSRSKRMLRVRNVMAMDAKRDIALETCPTCNGRGSVVRTRQTFMGIMQSQETCPKCHGEGVIITHKCKHCNGEGVTAGEEIVEIKIPAGVAEGMMLNVPQKGNAALTWWRSYDIRVIIEGNSSR